MNPEKDLTAFWQNVEAYIEAGRYNEAAAYCYQASQTFNDLNVVLATAVYFCVDRKYSAAFQAAKYLLDSGLNDNVKNWRVLAFCCAFNNLESDARHIFKTLAEGDPESKWAALFLDESFDYSSEEAVKAAMVNDPSFKANITEITPGAQDYFFKAMAKVTCAQCQVEFLSSIEHTLFQHVMMMCPKCLRPHVADPVTIAEKMKIEDEEKIRSELESIDEYLSHWLKDWWEGRELPSSLETKYNTPLPALFGDRMYYYFGKTYAELFERFKIKRKN